MAVASILSLLPCATKYSSMYLSSPGCNHVLPHILQYILSAQAVVVMAMCS